MNRKSKKPASKVKYRFIAFRPATPLQDTRIRTLAKTSGMKISDVVQKCIAAHLPVLETHAKGQ